MSAETDNRGNRAGAWLAPLGVGMVLGSALTLGATSLLSDDDRGDHAAPVEIASSVQAAAAVPTAAEPAVADVARIGGDDPGALHAAPADEVVPSEPTEPNAPDGPDGPDDHADGEQAGPAEVSSQAVASAPAAQAALRPSAPAARTSPAGAAVPTASAASAPKETPASVAATAPTAAPVPAVAADPDSEDAKLAAAAQVRVKGDTVIDSMLDQALTPAQRKQAQPAVTGALPQAPTRDDVIKAMSVLVPAIRGCAQGQSGLAPVSIVVLSDGRVESAALSGGPFQGTASGRCMEGVVRRARFPRFKQANFKVQFPFSVQ